MVYTKLLKTTWESLYDPQKQVMETMDEFFHQDYEQCINGTTMNRDEYIHHVVAQKKI